MTAISLSGDPAATVEVVYFIGALSNQDGAPAASPSRSDGSGRTLSKTGTASPAFDAPGRRFYRQGRAGASHLLLHGGAVSAMIFPKGDRKWKKTRRWILRGITQALWKSYFSLDRGEFESIFEWLDENCSIIGTGKHEFYLDPRPFIRH